MSRKPLSDLLGKSIGRITYDDDPEYLLFWDDEDKVLFSVHRDRIFDANENEFEQDIS